MAMVRRRLVAALGAALIAGTLPCSPRPVAARAAEESAGARGAPPAAPAAAPDEWAIGPVPEAVRASLRLAASHVKHLDAGGVPILGSAAVADDAMREARHLVLEMTAHRPALRAALARRRVRVVVMAPAEFTTDVPEHAHLRPRRYWDFRARGVGATSVTLAVSCGEENLLGYHGDPYADESILVHEFAHTLHLLALPEVDPRFAARLSAAYDDACRRKIWDGTYASKDVGEYWAEGTQSWFDTNTEGPPEHNHVDTRAELRVHDPALAALCEGVYGDGRWRYARPLDREPPSAHVREPTEIRRGSFSWLRWRPRDDAADGKGGDGSPRRAELLAPGARDRWTSKGSGESSVLIVHNLTGARVDVTWMGFDGTAAPWVRVDAGEARPVETYAGHVFRIATIDGVVLGYVLVEGAETTLDVRVPATPPAAPSPAGAGADAPVPR